MILKLFLVAIGGGAGACLRYLIAVLFTQLFHVSVLYATLTTNLTGCYVIGLLWGLNSTRQPLSEPVMLLLATGFLGGLTTFSTLQLELFIAWHQRNLLLLFGYLAVSLLLGFVAVCAGVQTGKAL